VRQRYVALRAESPQPVDERDVMNALWDMVYQLYGEFGASQTALHQVSWDRETTTLVVRCSHKMLEPVWAAAAAITTIDEKRVAIRVVAVSGTLKALQKKVERQRR
jgi:RNase P/RNase MRP subunit POP5